MLRTLTGTLINVIRTDLRCVALFKDADGTNRVLTTTADIFAQYYCNGRAANVAVRIEFIADTLTSIEEI